MSDSANTEKKVLRVTLVKSAIGYSKRHKATVRALGLRHALSSKVKDSSLISSISMWCLLDRHPLQDLFVSLVAD